MESGQYAMAMFFSATVVIGATFFALMHRFLKENNERLRELTVALKTRREEEPRRARSMSRQIAEPPAEATLQADQAILASEIGLASATAPPPAASRTTLHKDWDALLTRGSEPSRAVAKPAVSVQRVKVELRQDLLDAVLAGGSSRKPDVFSPPAAAGTALPSGFHDGSVLGRLAQAQQPVSGLVVSIGLHTAAGWKAPQATGDTPACARVREMIQSLISTGDFACPSGEDEFLLIFPRERGAAAQRRLSMIAQQLWDFQLQSLGELQILCSWGGVEVRGEGIGEATASARERMHETQRGRQRVRFGVPLQPAL